MTTSAPPALASFYERHMALVDGAAWAWQGSAPARRMLDDVRQVGVSQSAWFALRGNGELLRVADDAAAARVLMRGVKAFAAGESGWFAIDAQDLLWHAERDTTRTTRVAEHVIAACIGDSADYFITRDGRLHVKGLAHRGQYGDGRLQAQDVFVVTATDVVDVRAHTGHAICLRRDGVVLGTGGNRFGPLGLHGLGDKADRWGPIFDGASAIATGSRHSLALRPDGGLWAWGEGFAMKPAKLLDGVVAIAAGDTATLAITADGAWWQWERGVAGRPGAPRSARPG